MHCQLEIDFGNLYSPIADRKTSAKRMNSGIGTADVIEEADKYRHRHSKYSRRSKAIATKVRFLVILNLSVFNNRLYCFEQLIMVKVDKSKHKYS